jgi:hypothetical protein
MRIHEQRGKEKDIPSSTPYANSNDCPVSSQIGNGIYCSSFLSFEICSPVSLFAHQPSSSPFCHTQSQSLCSSPFQPISTSTSKSTQRAENSHAPIQTLHRNLRPIMITRQRNPAMFFRHYSIQHPHPEHHSYAQYRQPIPPSPRPPHPSVSCRRTPRHVRRDGKGA